MAQPISASVSPVFLPLQLILIGLDLFISLVTFGWINVFKTLTKTNPVRTVPVGDDVSHRVMAGYKGKLVETPANGASTLYECLDKTVAEHGSKVGMQKRAFLGWKSSNLKEFSPESTGWTYSEIGRMARKFGAALAEAGCVPSDPVGTLEKVAKPCRVVIFENTCMEWMVAAQGAFSQSLGVVTVYATLGIDSVADALVDNSASVLICNKTNVMQLVAGRDRTMPCLKTIVYTNDLIGPDDTVEMPTDVPSDLTVVSFEDFVASGNTERHPVVPPTPDMAAVIMYTSGSTGKPKGVVVRHRALVSCIAATEIRLDLDATCSYIGYLPLAHIFELMVELCVITFGGCISYADPKSLIAAHPTGAFEAFRPTHLVAVPKIWDIIKKNFSIKVAKMPPVAQALVGTALRWRRAAIQIGLGTPLFDILVFEKLRALLGGRVRQAMSGGGPLNGDVQTFVNVAFGFPFVQGYGLTETCGPLTVQDDDDRRPGVVGSIMPSVEIKLESCPEIRDRAGSPYLSTDRTDADGATKIWGRGEILARGRSLGIGYYGMPEKTREVFSDDGWFATGDIGQFLEDGSISVVDRKKNLVKIKCGEYVALEKMEVVYGNSDFVDAVAGGICCYGDGDMDRCVALVQISKPTSMQWAKSAGLVKDDTDAGWVKVKNSTELYEKVLESFATEHSNSDLSRIEKLVAVCLLDEPWTAENGCLTASNKLQRRKVLESFSTEFDAVKQKGIFQ